MQFYPTSHLLSGTNLSWICLLKTESRRNILDGLHFFFFFQRWCEWSKYCTRNTLEGRSCHAQFGMSPVTGSWTKFLSQSHFLWWQQDIGISPQKYYHSEANGKLEHCCLGWWGSKPFSWHTIQHISLMK